MEIVNRLLRDGWLVSNPPIAAQMLIRPKLRRSGD
jgi:hypothetical protein